MTKRSRQSGSHTESREGGNRQGCFDEGALELREERRERLVKPELNEAGLIQPSRVEPRVTPSLSDEDRAFLF